MATASLAHLPRHAPYQGEPSSPAAPRANPYARYFRSAGRTTSTTWNGLLRKFETARRPGAPARAAQRGATDAAGRAVLRLHQPGDAGSAGRAHGRNIHIDALRLRAFPQDRWTVSSPRTNRCLWSSRTATPRCTPCWSTSWASDPARCSSRCCTTTARRSRRASLPRPSGRIPSARRRPALNPEAA